MRIMTTNGSDESSIRTHVLATKAFVWTYMIPVLCVLGLLTNSINALVFSQRKKLKNSIYRYFIWHSIADLVYLSLCFVRFILHLERFKYLQASFYFLLYEFVVYVYFTSCLAILMILIELLIAAKRLLIVTNINLTFKLKFRTIVVVFSVLSCLAFTPLLLAFRLTCQDVDCVKWTVVSINSSHSQALRNAYFSASIFRGFVAPFLLLAINIALSVKFRKLCQKKNYLTSTKLVTLNPENGRFCCQVTLLTVNIDFTTVA